jgi:hypothetical protein
MRTRICFIELHGENHAVGRHTNGIIVLKLMLNEVFSLYLKFSYGNYEKLDFP